MNPKKGLVGKELPVASKQGSAKGGAAKPALGSKMASQKDLTKGSSGKSLLTLEEVGERLRVGESHVQNWLKDGLLKGSSQGVQPYELEKFRAKYHQEITRAQNAPQRSEKRAEPKPQPTPTKKKPVVEKDKASVPAPEPSPGPIASVFAALGSVLSNLLRSKKKPAKTAPYVRPPEIDEDSIEFDEPVVAPIAATAVTAHISRSKVTSAEELVPPPAPSQEVWPSLEDLSSQTSSTPTWLQASSEPGDVHETLILRADQIQQAMRAAPTPPSTSEGLGSASLARELQEEKQRNQKLLQQLQDQRRIELDLQDEMETLKQRLDLSVNSEREVRAQLKRSRQELQTALEELEQRPPAGMHDPEETRKLLEEKQAWEAERTHLLQQNAQLDQRKSLLEQQIERLRAQAEEIRQHGLQWHQLATKQDQQLRALKQQHSDLEVEAERALAELERRVVESEAVRARAEAAYQQMASRAQSLQSQLEDMERLSGGNAFAELQARDHKILQLQARAEQFQASIASLESQQRAQIQRWEQELQASASWVQKLTDAVAQRDRRIQELEAQVAQAGARESNFNEEELKSQVMSLRVELTSLRRNYEIITLQAKNLENQLQEARRTAAPAPITPPPAAPAPSPVAAPPVLSLDISPKAPPQDEEGGFRRRLNNRLRALGVGSEERTGGLEPPPFLELELPES